MFAKSELFVVKIQLILSMLKSEFILLDKDANPSIFYIFHACNENVTNSFMTQWLTANKKTNIIIPIVIITIIIIIIIILNK